MRDRLSPALGQDKDREVTASCLVVRPLEIVPGTADSTVLPQRLSQDLHRGRLRPPD